MRHSRLNIGEGKSDTIPLSSIRENKNTLSKVHENFAMDERVDGVNCEVSENNGMV